MKLINIFKAGTHTASNGVTLPFTEDKVRAIAANYDPQLHEAPLVIGHPEENGPAYGWVSGVSYSEERGLDATPSQVNADFDEMVAAGSFKKISASLYTPNHPANPVPGEYYLRHVGFFGATPPAIKGLKPVEFKDAKDGEVVEFSMDFGAWEDRQAASLWRRMREFLISQFGMDQADKVVPDYAVQDMEAAAEKAIDNPDAPAPGFSEPQEGGAMTEEELKAAREQLEKDREALDKDQADFKERQDKLDTDAKAANRAVLVAQVDKLVDAGKVLPAHKDALVDLMEALPDDQVLVFGEGDGAPKLPGAEWLGKFLADLPKQVDYKERAGADAGDPPDIKDDANALANRALAYREEQKQAGRDIPLHQAMAEMVTQLGD